MKMYKERLPLDSWTEESAAKYEMPEVMFSVRRMFHYWTVGDLTPHRILMNPGDWKTWYTLVPKASRFWKNDVDEPHLYFQGTIVTLSEDLIPGEVIVEVPEDYPGFQERRAVQFKAMEDLEGLLEGTIDHNEYAGSTPDYHPGWSFWRYIGKKAKEGRQG